MSNGIYTALSGAIAQERNLDIVANNVANVNTTGYRADRVSFQQIVAPENPLPEVVDPISYVSIAETQVDNSPGSMRQTGNPLDLALMGDGYFAVSTPRGERYTRAGAFTTNSDGRVVSPAGDLVQAVGDDPTDPENGGIRIPATAEEIAIANDGTVQVDGEVVGRLRIVAFDDPAAIQKEGVTLYTADQPPLEVGPGEITVVQGHLETANFNAVGGMTELISASRSFDIFQKTIDTFRRLDERAAKDIAARS